MDGQRVGRSASASPLVEPTKVSSLPLRSPHSSSIFFPHKTALTRHKQTLPSSLRLRRAPSQRSLAAMISYHSLRLSVNNKQSLISRVAYLFSQQQEIAAKNLLGRFCQLAPCTFTAARVPLQRVLFIVSRSQPPLQDRDSNCLWCEPAIVPPTVDPLLLRSC